MDRYWEGQHGCVADLDVVGPTTPLVEYAAYTTSQMIRAYIRGCEPWEIDWTTID